MILKGRAPTGFVFQSKIVWARRRGDPKLPAGKVVWYMSFRKHGHVIRSRGKVLCNVLPKRFLK